MAERTSSSGVAVTSSTFTVVPLRFHCRAARRFQLDANFLRGWFGKSLRSLDRELYERLFDPKRVHGPSGLKDAPRPFVFRVRDQNVAPGGAFDFGFHLFDPDQPLDPIVDAFGQIAEVVHIEGCEPVHLPLTPAEHASRIRVRFLTPTELKGGLPDNGPPFPLLFARIRDRISTLRALYQGGPLDIDFKALAQRAAQIEMIRCEVQRIEAQRTSRRTGQTHSLGGFVGFADYQGDLGEFLPYLEIARWTGVGRQTVWGKGELACDKI